MVFLTKILNSHILINLFYKKRYKQRLINDYYISTKYNIDKKYRFNSYDELINSDEIDAVYIATLNNTHKDLIIKSIDAKKNILCEKPITINDQEIKDVYKKVKDSKIFFREISELNKSINLTELSMGMSSDYLEAIKYNATYLRIGTSIFGERSI